MVKLTTKIVKSTDLWSKINLCSKSFHNIYLWLEKFIILPEDDSEHESKYSQLKASHRFFIYI
jgi:hypothetical protein